jgi:hypothetical protein
MHNYFKFLSDTDFWLPIQVLECCPLNKAMAQILGS